MTATLKTAATCRRCRRPMSPKHADGLGRMCEPCRARAEMTESCRRYLDQVVFSDDTAALEDAVGTLELLLARHGLWK